MKCAGHFLGQAKAAEGTAPYTHLLHWSQLDDPQPIPPHPGPLPQPSRGRYGSAGREREDRRQSVGESYVLAMFEGRPLLHPLLGERAGLSSAVLLTKEGVRGNGSSDTLQHSK